MKTPTLLLIGDNDLRVPPHQGYYYYNALKQMGVDAKLYNYPGSGHGLAPVEHTWDAYMNISLWMDKYLNVPHLPLEESEKKEDSKKDI